MKATDTPVDHWRDAVDKVDACQKVRDDIEAKLHYAEDELGAARHEATQAHKAMLEYLRKQPTRSDDV